jgi:tRNA(fMet)-specific endonuclease VapC
MAMKYLLDTNSWILYLKNPNSRIESRLTQHLPEEIVTCSIVLSELLHGAEKYGNRIRRLSTIRKLLAPFYCYPFDEFDAEAYAQLRHALELKGQIIGPYDLQIAAICLRHELTLVTNNTSEFSRVAELNTEDWSR